MSNLPFVVVQYELDVHPRRTEHWALAVITNTATGDGRVFQLVGNKDTFGFESRDANIENSVTYCGGVQIGTVPSSRISELEMWLKAVPIHRGRDDWDCQDWVIDATRALVMDNRGVMSAGMSERRIREELEEEKERNQTGNELVTERMRA